MKTLNLVQGTPEWAAHRANHFNASDAPAMLGCSAYKKRSDLVRETATCIGAEIDSATQARFDIGHRAEALARPLAEAIIGQDLYPCVGVADDSPHSASFDGLTLMEDEAFEHKALNDTLRAAMVEGCTGADLPKAYRVQMEQQLLVCGGDRVLFMASKWNNDDSLVEERHCWYYPDPDLRAEILAGWEQFAADVAAYAPEPVAPAASVGRAPDSLPALSIQVTGMVTASNLAEFKSNALAVLGSINRDLKTDDDFANAEQTVKWCKGVEERLEATKQQVLGQTADIDAVFRTMDEVSAETRRIRLELGKLVDREKETRRLEIVTRGRDAYTAHVEELKAETKGVWLPLPPPDFAGAIKGKRTLSSMQDAVDTVLANAKIAANESAKHIRAALACLTEETAEHKHLFPDYLTFIGKPVEDIRALVRGRIAEHQQREAEKLEQERERIRQEEQNKLAAEQRRKDEEARRAQEASTPAPAATVASAPAPVAAAAAPAAALALAAVPAVEPGRRLRLGDINAAIAPLSINADGLASLGFRPVGTAGAAKLYAGEDLPRICTKLVEVIQQAPARVALKAAA